jgi:hypothetical protein
MKLKGVAFLRPDIYAHNLKPCPMVAHTSPAGAAK